MSNKRKRLSWDALVEERIQGAQAEGQFDNLPGFGKRCAAIDEPYDELWWVKRFLRRENLANLPISLEIRRDVERELTRIMALPDEQQVRDAVARLNEKIFQANLRAVHGPPSNTPLLEADDVVVSWRRRREA